jgi:hypothetical protein
VGDGECGKFSPYHYTTWLRERGSEGGSVPSSCMDLCEKYYDVVDVIASQGKISISIYH